MEATGCRGRKQILEEQFAAVSDLADEARYNMAPFVPGIRQIWATTAGLRIIISLVETSLMSGAAYNSLDLQGHFRLLAYSRSRTGHELTVLFQRDRFHMSHQVVEKDVGFEFAQNLTLVHCSLEKGLIPRFYPQDPKLPSMKN